MMLKIINTWFRNMQLAGKMMLAYLLLVGLVCAAALITVQISLDVYDQKLYEKSLQELDFFAQRVNTQLQEVEEFCYHIAMDAEIQQQLSQIRELPHLTAEYNYQMYRLRLILMNELYSKPIIKNIVYTDQYKNRMVVGEDCGRADTAVYEEMLRQMHDAHGGYIVFPPTDGYPYLLSGRDILKHTDHSMDYLGTYMITCDVAGVIDAQRSTLSAPHSELFIAGDSGSVYQQGELDAQAWQLCSGVQGWRILHSGGQRYFICWLRDGSTGWLYLNRFPYSEIYGQIMRLRYIMFAVLVALFVFSAFLMRRLARAVTRPLHTLTESMRVVETGDFKAAKEMLPGETTKDETGQLTQEFRAMLDKIDTLIYENYEKQLLLQEVRYQMLQAQINPHFLNNTLNTVAWMVKAGRNQDAEKVIVELGKLLRAALAKGAYTSVERDVEQVRAYIAIQKFRYGGRADFQIHCEGNLSDSFMPKMVLQPLVENAIYHSIENSLEHCTVQVSALEKEGHILLEVCDTGIGMAPERMEAVRNFTAKPKGHGIGLKNIRERLETAFSGQCRFTIESQPGRGTMVRIQIPKRKEEELDGQAADC